MALLQHGGDVGVKETVLILRAEVGGGQSRSMRLLLPPGEINVTKVLNIHCSLHDYLFPASYERVPPSGKKIYGYIKS